MTTLSHFKVMIAILTFSLAFLWHISIHNNISLDVFFDRSESVRSILPYERYWFINQVKLLS